VSWLVGLVLLGCGNTASSGPHAAGGMPTPASGGSGTSGANSTGGAGGSGGAGAEGASAGAGGLFLGDSKTEACIAYAVAFCTRRAECSGHLANCLAVSLTCPDLTFLAGSTRAVADLKACADVYRQLPCDEIERGIEPHCVTPGTRALGEPCGFASQCASLACSSGRETCGVCVPAAHEGESCGKGEDCAGFLECIGNVCELPGKLTQSLGEECSDAAAKYCQAGLSCDKATSKCVPYPTLGMSCAGTRNCGGEAYCELAALTCQAYPGVGMSCGVDISGDARYCAEPLRCVSPSKGVGTCMLYPQAGEACLLAAEAETTGYQLCEAGLRCDTATSPATCAAKGGPTQVCSFDRDCVSGLTCVCLSGQAACADRVCGRLQLRGQPCTAPGDVCHPGFSCVAGVCEPRDSQGLFASCGG